MEKIRRAVKQIAYTKKQKQKQKQKQQPLSLLQLSLVPLLSFVSSLYTVSLPIRRFLYTSALLAKYRLPVPVISVGNLTYGGNGKTPMVEFIALWFATCGISPLILTRGYGGADEARMLQRHLEGTCAKIGIGANRAVTATAFIAKYGCLNHNCMNLFQKSPTDLHSEKIGVAILDDGMQHLSLSRDLEIVMVNGMMPWGNGHLLPLGPLREPLSSLSRADIVIIHHADMVSGENLKAIERTIHEAKESLPIYFTEMKPSHFFKVGKVSSSLTFETIRDKAVLCVSAIGSPDSFVQRIQKMGPLYVDRLDFSDHHSFQIEDLELIKTRLEKLRSDFASDPIIVVTEKDYDRDREILKPFYISCDVLVLCSKLEILPHRSALSEDSFKKLLIQLLELNFRSS